MSKKIRIKGNLDSKTWFINGEIINKPITVGKWTIRCIRNHRLMFYTQTQDESRRQIKAMMSFHKPHFSVRYLDRYENITGEKFEYLANKIDGYVVLTDTDIIYRQELSNISEC